MNDALLEMARQRFGYGRWDAPFWFVGPAEGMDAAESGDLAHRLEAWTTLGKPGLCDCREFHCQTGLAALLKWHRRTPPPPLNRTWKQLMLLLMTFSGTPADLAHLREYQRVRWGMSDGESCVIELSGLAAKGVGAPGDHRLFREGRIAEMRDRMDGQTPKLVVMCGWGERESYRRIAGCSFAEHEISHFSAMTGKKDGTRVAIAYHPNAKGLPNAYWVELGGRLRNLM